jgi:hypothetical protein
MRDHLLDLVQHTLDLGFIDLVKINGTEEVTAISGVAQDKSVVVQGQFATPVAEFIGTFGMPNLNKLKIILNLQEYRENAKLSISRRSDGTSDGIDFENAAGDFKNNYRFMAANIVNEQLKDVKFKGANWNVDFEPSVASIMRLKMQSQANAEESVFRTKTEDGDLKFVFGDHSSHAGEFVFQGGVDGLIKRQWSWPVLQIISILGLVGNKRMQISDDGVMQITVDSGLAVYTYIIPAQTK